MANEFFNGNQVITPTSGCGVGPLPGVAVFQPEVTCPGAGYGASTYASPATPLAIGLTVPIAKFFFSSSAGPRNVLFGSEFSEACLALIESEVGTVVSACDTGVATLNRQAQIDCCFWDSNQQLVAGFVAKPNGDIDNLSATQILFQPCNPCFSSDTDFVCTNGCNNNSNFILTNAVIGANAGIVIDIPAGVALTIEMCSCAPQVNSFATCPVSYPAVAQIASAPACPPADTYQTPSALLRGY